MNTKNFQESIIALRDAEIKALNEQIQRLREETLRQDGKQNCCQHVEEKLASEKRTNATLMAEISTLKTKNTTLIQTEKSRGSHGPSEELLRRFQKCKQLTKKNFRPGPALIIHVGRGKGSGPATIKQVEVTSLSASPGRVHYIDGGIRSTAHMKNVRIESESAESTQVDIIKH